MKMRWITSCSGFPSALIKIRNKTPKYLRTNAARFHRLQLFQSDLDLLIESFGSDATTGPEYSDNTIFLPLARQHDSPAVII